MMLREKKIDLKAIQNFSIYMERVKKRMRNGEQSIKIFM